MIKQSQRAVIEELLFTYQTPVRDPLWKHIYISPGIEALLHTSEMQELSQIKQLGPTHLVYPGAVHTRLNHSLGVFHLARQIIISLLKSGSLDFCTAEGVRAFLAASLLHDLGHFPYTHSLKELPLKDHERLGGEIIGESRELRQIITDGVGTEPDMVQAIIDQGIETGDREIMVYRSLLSGPLDPDKLDYLNRDAYFCGVPYGIQDIDYIISKLYWSEKDMKPGIDISGIGALENLIFSKYLMYRYVYWHRSVRAAAAMVKRALFSGLTDGVISPEDLYRVHDDSLLSLCRSRDYKPFSLIDDVQQNRLYRCRSEIPFNPDNPEHKKLEDLSYRVTREKELSLGRDADDIIIDVPERISFELNIPMKSHQAVSSPIHIFTPAVVASMEQGLRMIRVFTHPEHPGADDLPLDILV